MRTRTSPFRLLTVLALSGCALLLASGSASAAHPKVVHQKASFSFEAHLPSADGYALYLRADNHRDIRVEVEREGGAEPYVVMFYRVKGHVGRHGIEADLGRFGRVSLRFSGAPKRNLYRFPNCRGSGPEVQQSGVLRGRLEFESLGGTVKLSTTEVKGETRRAPQRTCIRRPTRFNSGFFSERPVVPEPELPEEIEELAEVTFLARAHTLGRTIDIFALGPEPGEVDLAAKSTRRFGDVVVSTMVYAPEREGEPQPEVLVTGRAPRPTGATISAPSPFSGTATYSDQPGSRPTFLGSLEVRIPGEGTLPLAGPEFHAAICAFLELKKQRACEEAVAPAHTV